MLTWIIGGLLVWTLGILFVLALMRMASDQDRAARHEELLRNLSSPTCRSRRFGTGY